MIWDALPDFDEMWEKSFTLASDFKNEFGTIIIPINFVYKNYSIGKWISHQRQLYKKNKLSEDRIHKLESIGMVWDVNDYLWNKNYEILSEYYSLNGDVDIPSSLEYKNIKLGKWLQNQKSSYKGYKGRKKLTEEQIIKLEKLNIKFK